jgi:MFS family permease
VLPFVGIIGDRYGRKPLLSASLLLLGAGGLGLVFTTNFLIAVLLRGFQGLGWAGISTMTITLIGDWYDTDEGNTAQAFRTFTIQATGMIAPLVVVWLVVVSWRLSFGLFVLALPFAAFAWVILDEPASAEKESRLDYTQSLYAVLQDRTVLLILLSFFPRMVIRYGFLSFVSVLVITHLEYGPALAGILVSVAAGVKMVTTSQMGRLTTLVPDPFRIVIIGFFFAGAGFTGLGLVKSIPLLAVSAAFTGIGDGLLSPTQKGILVDQVSKNYRSGIVGVGMFSQNAGATAAPLAFGALLFLLEITVGFVLIGVLSAAAGIAFVLYARRMAIKTGAQ